VTSIQLTTECKTGESLFLEQTLGKIPNLQTSLFHRKATLSLCALQCLHTDHSLSTCPPASLQLALGFAEQQHLPRSKPKLSSETGLLPRLL